MLLIRHLKSYLESKMEYTVKDIIDRIVEVEKLIHVDKDQASNEIMHLHEELIGTVENIHGISSERNCEDTVLRCHEDYDEPCEECEG